jgi:hypothetical protein
MALENARVAVVDSYDKAKVVLDTGEYDIAVAYWQLIAGRTFGALFVFCKDKETADDVIRGLPGHDGTVDMKSPQGYPLIRFAVQLGFLLQLLDFPYEAKVTWLDK